MLNYAQLSRADISLFVLFDLLFEERSAARAARRLNLTPSAISHSLRRLRAMLDDPLFIPARGGLVPTDRAIHLRPEIHSIVARMWGVVSSAKPFDPRSTVRRFRIGAPDGAAATMMLPLLERFAREAPAIDVSILQILPDPGSNDPAAAWRTALEKLEQASLDLVILPHRPQSSRYRVAPLLAERFVLLTAAGHHLSRSCTVECFAAASHVLVTATGDTHGFVDTLLEARGLRRRVKLTVPSFHMAAAAIADSDLVGAVPERFARAVATFYRLDIVEPPFAMPSNDLHSIALEAAMLDDGISWLFDRIGKAVADIA